MESKFKVGDIVRVVDNGLTYDRHIGWVKNNIENWVEADHLADGSRGVVTCIAPHSTHYSSCMLVCVESEGQSYILEERGLELVEEDMGIKHDSGKPRWSLLPFKQLEQVVEVLTFGAAKYSDDNWKKVEPVRYKDAMLRHVTAYLSGEKNDPESGKHHLAHAICCGLFLMFFDQEEK